MNDLTIEFFEYVEDEGRQLLITVERAPRCQQRGDKIMIDGNLYDVLSVEYDVNYMNKVKVILNFLCVNEI